MRHVIIGNSAAGITAAETLRHLEPNSEIIMIADEDQHAYSRCLLPDFLAGHRDERGLQIRPWDFYMHHRIQTVFGYKALSVDPEFQKVVLEGGTHVFYDKLLIATGASGVLPPIPGIHAENVFTLRHLSDARKILRACSKARRVVIVGAGFVGLEAASALYRMGNEVTVVEKIPQILPLQFDTLAAEIILRDIQAEGIRFILGKGIKEITPPGVWSRLFGRPGSGVVLEDGTRLKAEVILVATGARPNIELVRDSGMALNRGIPVNEYMETSIRDIYAAGDVAETKDIVTGQTGLTPIWPNANAQGRIAAFNMAGRRRVYGGMIGMQNAVEFRDVPAIAMGLTQPAGSEYQVLADYRPIQNRYKKLVLKNNVLVGMILVGDIHQAGVYGALIKQRVKVDWFSGELMRDDFSYGCIFCPASSPHGKVQTLPGAGGFHGNK